MADQVAAPANASTPVTTTPENGGVSENVDAVANPVTPAEVKEAKRLYKLKFGKDTREVDESTLVAMAQKGWASDEKFNKASSKEKDLARLVAKFNEDPDAFIRHMGGDPVEVYKRQLAKELQRRVMSPEQRELADAKAKLEEFQAKEKARQDKEHQDQVSKLQAKYEEEYDRDMSKAIIDNGLPKNPKTIKRMAQLAYKNLEMGLDLPWNTLADMVKEEYKQDVKELFGASEADKLLEMFGPDIAKKIAGASMKSRASNPEPVLESNRKAAKPTKEQDIPKYASNDDWEERMRKFKNS